MSDSGKISMAALLIFLMVYACVEPFEAQTETFEDAVVIDALITTELKQHRVALSRSYAFEDEVPRAERNAQVKVVDDQGAMYSFQESEPGIYISSEPFAATAGRTYVLEVETSDGRSYRSETVRTPENVGIDELSAVRETNDFGEEGVSILLSNTAPAGDPRYFRYEYEETYKIIAPFWNPFEFVVIDDVACEDGDAFEVGITPETDERRVCYSSAKSVDIIQGSTVGLTENNLLRFPVRFLNRDNYIISHRYSILVTQYTQTPEAHSFYQNLNDFSSSESIFSERQPGFLAGNVLSENSENELVLGYFEVASVTSQRIYFNYEDLFPGEDLPPYAISCFPTGKPPLVTAGYHCADMICDGDCSSPLIDQIKADLIVYFDENDNFENEIIELGGFSQTGPYLTKAAACGDCRKLGSNMVPEFWEE